jgi:UDP-N-acetylmuramyl pentapeptide phosphotransferase/UDP-N-acetylglucosamine-1-phosphate transferase
VTSAGARDHLLTLAASAAASWAAHRIARRLPAAIAAPWERTNHAGRTVTLLEGPAFVAGALTGALTGATLGRVAQPGARAAVAVAAGAAGALGALDDIAGGTTDKGLRGHLAALRRGEVTTGAVKVVGLAATGLVAAALVDRGHRAPLDTLVGGAVVAGAANAVNLFDLRPGRALKVTVATALPLVAGTPGAAAVGASLGVIRDDLAARSMLGDTGANAAGALVGIAVVERTGLLGRTLALGGLAALTLASERVSFTHVIEGNRVMRRLDEWGRETR